MDFLIRRNCLFRRNTLIMPNLPEDINENCPKLICMINNGDGEDGACPNLACGVNNGTCPVLECGVMN